MPHTLHPTASAASPSRLTLSQMAPGVIQSEIRAMSVECDRIGGINLAQGVCDTPVPTPVQEAAIEAIHAGFNIYTRLDGIASLRQAIAAKQMRDYNLEYDPESEILVTSGATGGLHAAAMALFNPGDEVLLFEPFYGYHVSTLQSMRVVPVLVPLAEPDFALDIDALRAVITPHTRALILNTPANPSGKVFTWAELEAIAEVAIEHDLFVLTDEIYEYFVYDGARHISPAELPGMKERTIVISGFSKTFSVTGWRLGYITASAKWLPAMAYFHDLTYVCAPSPLAARGRRGPGPASTQLLYPARRRLPIQTRPHPGGPARCGSRALGACRSLLCAGRRRPPSRPNRRGESAQPAGSDRSGRSGWNSLFPPRPRRKSAALLLCQTGQRTGRGVRPAAPFVNPQ